MAAVTAKFLADFSSFYDATKQAEVSLKGMETNAHKVEKSMNAVADSFSGRKIAQDAQIAVEAVNQIGGATKLTVAEATRLNAQVTEAIAKYKALGQTAPKELTDMAKATAKVKDETAKLPSTFGKITSSLSSMAGAFGLAFSAQAIVGFVSGVVDSAGKIADLSAKLGIGTEAVQAFTYAAELSGGTIDDVGQAIFKMSDNIASGSKTTTQALDDLGLKLSDLRKMKPEDAFLAITDALKKIENPMVRARLEMELFGKSGGALGAAIDAGFRDTANAANKMSDDTIQALDKAGDAWTKLKNGIVVATGTALAETLTFFEKVERRFDEIIVKAGKAIGLAPPKGFDVTGQRIAPGKDIHLPAEGAGAGAGVTAGAAERERLAREQAAANREAAQAARQHADAVRNLRDQLSGEGAIKQAKLYIEALSGIKDVSKLNADVQKQISDVLWKAVEAYRVLGKEVPPIISRLIAETTRYGDTLKVTTGIDNLSSALKETAVPLANLTASTKQLWDTSANLAQWQKQALLEMSGGYEALSKTISGLPPLLQLVNAGFNEFDLKRWGEEAKAAAAPLMEMETVAKYMRAYGVDVETARKALGLMGDTGKEAMDKTAAATANATNKIVQMNTALGQNKTALDSVLAGHELMAAYAKSGVAMGTTLATGGWDFSMMQRAGVPTTNVARGLVTPGAGYSSQPWGNNNTLNVNVNNADAGNIADKLVQEMKRNGYRF